MPKKEPMPSCDALDQSLMMIHKIPPFPNIEMKRMDKKHISIQPHHPVPLSQESNTKHAMTGSHFNDFFKRTSP